MIASGLVDIINYAIQTFISPFPANFPLLSFDAYSSMLNSVSSYLIYAFSILDKVFPVYGFLTLILVMLGGELLLITFKTGVFIVNLIRGSGA